MISGRKKLNLKGVKCKKGNEQQEQKDQHVSMCRLHKAETAKVGNVPDIGTTAIMWN